MQRAPTATRTVPSHSPAITTPATTSARTATTGNLFGASVTRPDSMPGFLKFAFLIIALWCVLVLALVLRSRFAQAKIEVERRLLALIAVAEATLEFMRTFPRAPRRYWISFRRRQRLLTWDFNIPLPVDPATAIAPIAALLPRHDLGEALAFALTNTRDRAHAMLFPASEGECDAIMEHNTSPDQRALYRYIKRVGESLQLSWLIDGVAGCGKTTAYLNALRRIPRATIVTPSNALAAELRARLAEAGLHHPVLTPHLALNNMDPTIPCIIDEVFMLPEYHVGRISAVYNPCVGVGDRHQITDPGFLLPPAPITQAPDAYFLRSYTVPNDVLDIAKRHGIVDPNTTTASTLWHTIYRVTERSVLPNYGQRLCFANECAAGGDTVFTYQGQRDEIIILHACHRDLPVTAFAGFLWSAFTRHTRLLILDWAPVVTNLWQLDYLPEYDDPTHTVPS